MHEVVKDLIASLNLIEVKGKQNLVLLWNVINTLEQIRDAYRASEGKEGESNVEDKTGG